MARFEVNVADAVVVVGGAGIAAQPHVRASSEENLDRCQFADVDLSAYEVLRTWGSQAGLPFVVLTLRRP